MISKRVRNLIKITILGILLNAILPIFGGQQVQAKIVEEPKIILDLAHKDTETDTGATYMQWNERDIVNSITMKVGEKLVNNGFTVTYTRDLNKPATIQERINKANNSDYWLYLSIHANSNEGNIAGTGIEGYSNNEWSLTNNILNDLHNEFGLIKRSNPIKTPFYNRKIQNSTLLEIGFINNDYDRNIMLNNEDKIAQIIADNIIKDYNKEVIAKNCIGGNIVTKEMTMYGGSIIPMKITYY